MATPKKTENFGKSWSEEETDKLLVRVTKYDTVEEIAEKHGRTAGGITGKLKQIAKKMHDTGKTIDEIKETCKFLDEEEINKVINYVRPTKKTKVETDNKELVKLITELNESVKLLVKIELKKNNWTEKDILSPTNNDWNKELLAKMKKYKDDKTKLKEIRKECNVSVDDFYAKLDTL